MIEAADRLRRTLAQWNDTRVTLARLPHDPDGAWRLAIVQKRRALQQQIGAITAAMGDLGPAVSGLAEYEAFRSALSVVRTKIAMHQAEWPAVSIQPGNQSYILSVKGLRAANEMFARSAEQLLVRLTASPVNLAI